MAQVIYMMGSEQRKTEERDDGLNTLYLGCLIGTSTVLGA